MAPGPRSCHHHTLRSLHVSLPQAALAVHPCCRRFRGEGSDLCPFTEALNQRAPCNTSDSGTTIHAHPLEKCWVPAIGGKARARERAGSQLQWLRSIYSLKTAPGKRIMLGEGFLSALRESPVMVATRRGLELLLCLLFLLAEEKTQSGGTSRGFLTTEAR